MINRYDQFTSIKDISLTISATLTKHASQNTFDQITWIDQKVVRLLENRLFQGQFNPFYVASKDRNIKKRVLIVPLENRRNIFFKFEKERISIRIRY